MSKQKLIVEVSNKDETFNKAEIWCQHPPTIRTYINNEEQVLEHHYVKNAQDLNDDIEAYEEDQKIQCESNVSKIKKHLLQVGQGVRKSDTSDPNEGEGTVPRKIFATKASPENEFNKTKLCDIHKNFVRMKRRVQLEGDDVEIERIVKRKKDKDDDDDDDVFGLFSA